MPTVEITPEQADAYERGKVVTIQRVPKRFIVTFAHTGNVFDFITSQRPRPGEPFHWSREDNAVLVRPSAHTQPPGYKQPSGGGEVESVVEIDRSR